MTKMTRKGVPPEKKIEKNLQKIRKPQWKCCTFAVAFRMQTVSPTPTDGTLRSKQCSLRGVRKHSDGSREASEGEVKYVAVSQQPQPNH